MSDAVEIRSGGAVAVDTRSLEDAAHALDSVASLLEEAAADARRAVAMLELACAPWATGPHTAASIIEAAEEARALAYAVRSAAAVYEIVEARAEREAAVATGDEAAVRRLDARRDAIASRWPLAASAADQEEDDWRYRWGDELIYQSVAAAVPLGPYAMGAAFLVSHAGITAIRAAARGRVGRRSVLRGAVVPPPMEATSRATVVAPAGLADLAARIPPSPGRVRVERYPMPDRTTRYAVYIGGTQGFVGDEPWDMTSNMRLYSGARSDSYAATVAALREAGAGPGDVVYAVGHSQGAMIASHLAVEGGYDTRALVTFGSPVEAEVGHDTLSVQVRHRDDPVSLLAGSGGPVPVGAEGGFIAERTVDDGGSITDLALGAHGLDAYAETARLVDASGDPRAGRLRGILAELSGVEAESQVWAPRVSRPACEG